MRKVWLRAVWAACVCLVVGCGDSGDGQDPPLGDPNNGTNNDANNDNNDPPPNNDVNNAQNNDTEPCGGPCPQGQRCTTEDVCREDFDRGCGDDTDCRPDEVCQDVGGANACVRPPSPVESCPGAEGCEDGGGQLLVGASKKIITPPGYEQPLPEFMDGERYRGGVSIIGDRVTFRDCGLDMLCEGDPGYDGPDFGEGDGHLQGAWLAGFSHSRPALRYCPENPEGRCPEDQPWVGQLAHDDTYARLAVFRKGDVAVGLVVVDGVGYFYDETANVRALLGPDVDLDLIILASTHVHEAPDTIGQWGPGRTLPEAPGNERWFMDHINAQIAAGLTEAYQSARPATIKSAMADTGVQDLGVQDSRDPWIFDDDMAVMQALDAETGQTIATLVNWGNHAESLGSRNQWITADFPGDACRFIEQGMEEVTDGDGNVLAPAVEGAGGVAVFVMGAVGGLITPLRGAEARDREGNVWRSGSFKMSRAMGQQLAMRALDIAQQAPVADDPDLSFVSKEFVVPVENRTFQLAFLNLRILKRNLYNATTELDFEGQNIPSILTRASILRLGNSTFFTMPGEPFSEMLVGGYRADEQERFTPVKGNYARILCNEDLLPWTCDGTSALCPPDWACHPERLTCSPDPRACSEADPCSEGAQCTDGVCVRACETNEDCVAGFVCAESGQCVYSPQEAADAGVAFACLVRPSNDNPPDMEAAPEGPYIKERMPGEVIFTVALGHDELGYIVPTYDFVLAPDGAYLTQADGDHYEETNSIGPTHTLLIQDTITELLGAIE